MKTTQIIAICDISFTYGYELHDSGRDFEG
jgi:hypothetical protein